MRGWFWSITYWRNMKLEWVGQKDLKHWYFDRIYSIPCYNLRSLGWDFPTGLQIVFGILMELKMATWLGTKDYGKDEPTPLITPLFSDCTDFAVSIVIYCNNELLLINQRNTCIKNVHTIIIPQISKIKSNTLICFVNCQNSELTSSISSFF